MEDKTKDVGAEGGTRDTHEEEIECACCEDGSCSWNPNAQSEKDKGGVQVTPPQGHNKDPPVVLKRHIAI